MVETAAGVLPGVLDLREGLRKGLMHFLAALGGGDKVIVVGTRVLLVLFLVTIATPCRCSISTDRLSWRNAWMSALACGLL